MSLPMVVCLASFFTQPLDAMMLSLHSRQLEVLRSGIDGVDRQGYALHVEHLGTIQLPSGNPIELVAYWHSAKSVVSPLFGVGWTLPLVESRFVPVDANHFDLYQPDGVVRQFSRDPKNKNEIGNGTRRWRGRITGRIVKIWSHPEYPYGQGEDGAEMMFRDGRLVLIKQKGTIITLSYLDGKFQSLTVNGKRELVVTKNKGDEEEWSFTFRNGEWFKAVIRPANIPNDQGRLVQRRALSDILRAGGRIRRFTYGIEKRGRCFFKSPESMFVWNVDNRTISRMNGWTYSVSGEGIRWTEAKIRRENATGQAEERSFDIKTGLLIEEDINGVRITSRLFTSGALSGQVRWREMFRKGVLIERFEYAYDENCRLVYMKRIGGDRYSEQWFNSKGKLTKIRDNGNNATTREYLYMPNGGRIIVNGDQIVSADMWNASEMLAWYRAWEKGSEISPPKAISHQDSPMPGELMRPIRVQSCRERARK